MTLNDVAVIDSDQNVSVVGDPIGSMAPGAINDTAYFGTYALTQDDIDAGVKDNTATATGIDPSGTPVTGDGTDSQTLTPEPVAPAAANPAVQLEKTGSFNDEDGDGFADLGETISYAFTVTNTGDVELTGVTVGDPNVTVSGGPINLAPGASDGGTFLGTYILTQSDIDAGARNNTATATGIDPSGTQVSGDGTDTQTLTPEPEPGVSYIVTFAPGANNALKGAALSAEGAEVKKSINQLNISVVELPANSHSQAAQALKNNPNILTAELNLTRSIAATPNDPDYPQQWSLPQIGWDEAYGGINPAGSAVVAVLDTGIDVAHLDLASNVIAGTSILDGSDGTTDPHGHGTSMAGIIGAETGNSVGIAGMGYAGVQVMPVTVMAANGTGQDSDIIAGVVYATDNGADVILMGFSNPGYSQALQDAVDYAWNAGVVIVAATGNDASSTPTYPAGMAGVMGVSNTTQSDTLEPSSNFGDAVFFGRSWSKYLHNRRRWRLRKCIRNIGGRSRSGRCGRTRRSQ